VTISIDYNAELELEAAALCADRIMMAIPILEVASISPDTDHTGLQQKLRSPSYVQNRYASTPASGKYRPACACSPPESAPPPHRSVGRRSSGPRSNTSSPGPNNTVCWYHRHHGVLAQRCTKPCTKYKITEKEMDQTSKHLS
jgi:hypothetical protein